MSGIYAVAYLRHVTRSDYWGMGFMKCCCPKNTCHANGTVIHPVQTERFCGMLILCRAILILHVQISAKPPKS